MSNTIPTTKSIFRQVTIPVMAVRRDDDGDFYEDTIPGARIAVPFSTSAEDAIAKAFKAHREAYGIPANVHIDAHVEEKALKVGTTMPSRSGKARWRGRTV